MNSVTLIGRLTKNPELRYTSGTQNAVATFSIAVNRPFSKEKAADFLRVVAFGKQAENCERFLAKGRLVGIQGRIQTGSYKTEAGEMKYTTDIVADRVEFLEWGDKGGADSGRSPDAGGGRSNDRDDMIPEGFEEMSDDDMLF